MKNIGVDFYLFDDRLSGSFDLYRNDVTDLLGNASTSPLAIFSSRPINVRSTVRISTAAAGKSRSIRSTSRVNSNGGPT